MLEYVFLDYKHIKNHNRLTAVDLNRQKKLDANPKSLLTNKKVSKDQLTKIIQSDGFLGKLLGDLNKKNRSYCYFD